MMHSEMIHDILIKVVLFPCQKHKPKYLMLQFVRAKKAVVSNASMWDTLSLLPPEVVPKSYRDNIKSTPQCESFMHLHLGFDAEVSYSITMHC